MHKTARAVFGLSLLCAIGSAPVALAEQAPPKAEALTSIIERIRQDVGYYEVQAARWRSDVPDPMKQDERLTPAAGAVPAPACDTRDLDFDVTNVQASLHAVAAAAGTGSVELRVPLLGKEGSLDADANWQTTGTKTVMLTRRFRYSPTELASYQSSEDYQQLEAAHKQYHARGAASQMNPVLPIAETLIELRKSLIRSAEKLPCFERADDNAKPESNSITIEFLVQQAAEGTVGFNFWLVSAKAGAKIERTNVNTLVVNFAPHHGAVPVAKTDMRQFGEAAGPQTGG